ncbi:MAG: prenyltransferase/squalene oxidase repeat-containing protein [Planctomycetota bacterium]
MHTRILALTTCMLLACFLIPAQAVELPDRETVEDLAEQAEAWLLQQQQPDGSFFPGDQFKLGITQVATLALLDAGQSPESATISKAIDFIKRHVQDDGGIYNPQEGLGNYCTSLGLRALMRAEAADQELIERAQNYLIGIQNTDEDSINYGGIGYGRRGEGHEDLSNTSMAIEALKQSGLPADHPAMQRALQFVSRCQNLSATNDMDWAGNDGGGVYSPDSSMAMGSFHDGEQRQRPAESTGADVELNSYGSMTYALISSFIYLELQQGDPRVKAALDWTRRNYQFEVNPGMAAGSAREGLYYYYLMMGKTYDLTDTTSMQVDGSTVDWRADLFQAIERRMQGGQGMALWINDMPRWGEGIPHLTTAYMLTTLMRIHDSLPE